MTESQAKTLAAECIDLVRQHTSVTPFYHKHYKTWAVKLITGDWKSEFIELIPASHMKAIHERR
jgi:hypothetical protein